MSRRKKRKPRQSAQSGTMSIGDAVAMADDMGLPDGAWWAMIEELSGHDAGDIAEYLATQEESS